MAAGRTTHIAIVPYMGQGIFILLASILFCSLTDPANALSPAAQNAVRAVHGYWKKILDTRISFASKIMQYIVVSFIFLSPYSVMADINKIETDMGILYINTVDFTENIPEYIYNNYPSCKIS